MRCEYERIRPPGTLGFVHCVATKESGPDLMDKYKADGYAGPYQQAVKYWWSRLHTYPTKWDKKLKTKVTNFRTNLIVSFRMAKAKGTWNNDWAATVWMC